MEHCAPSVKKSSGDGVGDFTAWFAIVPMSMDAEVVVRKYNLPHEAELSANYLREHWIHARVDNDVLVNLDPFYSDAFGGVRLHVRAPQAERADALLKELEAAEKAARAERDPTTTADRAADRALAGAVLGILLPIVTHLLSAWIAWGIDWSALSARGRRRLKIALAIDLVAFALAALAIAYG